MAIERRGRTVQSMSRSSSSIGHLTLEQPCAPSQAHEPSSMFASGLKLVAAGSLQPRSSTAGENVPAKHDSQYSAPGSGSENPGGHAAQAVWERIQRDPSWHDWQACASSSSVNRPTGQYSHGVAALWSWSWRPAAQAVHSVAPSCANDPAGHGPQPESSEVAENVPAAQSAQPPLPSGLAPAPQSWAPTSVAARSRRSITTHAGGVTSITQREPSVPGSFIASVGGLL